MHEILHALGMFHEQSRKDRDNSVKIIPENIQTGKEHNFMKWNDISNSFLATDVDKFDFNSIMLYHSYSFSKNNLPTMVKAKDGSIFNTNRSYLSNGDIMALRYIYGPPVGTLKEEFSGTLIDNYDYYQKTGNGTWYINFSSATDINRMIPVIKTITEKKNGKFITTTSTSYVIIPKGTKSYKMGTTYTNIKEERGITIDFYNEFYTAY